jgi:hypothetical protein
MVTSPTSSDNTDEDMVELSRIYKILNDDAKLIVQDLKYSSKALRGTSFFLFFLAAGALLISVGSLTYFHSGPGLGFGYFLLVTGFILGGVGSKFYLDYWRMSKRYRRLFALFMRI